MPTFPSFQNTEFEDSIRPVRAAQSVAERAAYLLYDRIRPHAKLYVELEENDWGMHFWLDDHVSKAGNALTVSLHKTQPIIQVELLYDKSSSEDMYGRVSAGFLTPDGAPMADKHACQETCSYIASHPDPEFIARKLKNMLIQCGIWHLTQTGGSYPACSRCPNQLACSFVR